MSDEISLLPEDLRKKEQELKKTERQQPVKTDAAADLKFSIPAEENEEIEIIEVDEGEIDQVLQNEPPLTRLVYKFTNLLDEAKNKLFGEQKLEPPPKLPPQFFSPPPVKPAAKGPSVAASVVPGAPMMGSAPGAKAPATPAAAGAAVLNEAVKPKAQIKPFPTTPKRVRVIKRVRKPVRVSFVSDEDIRLAHIDVAKRRFTLITLGTMCLVLLVGGYIVLRLQRDSSNAGLAEANAQLNDIKGQITSKQTAWASFQNLEPRLRALRGLLDAHVSPTHLLQQIEDRTLPTVSYGSFAYTADGRVQLAVNADSLENAARQVYAFQTADFVKKVDASSYSIQYEKDSSIPSSVQFQIVLTLQDGALRTPVATK